MQLTVLDIFLYGGMLCKIGESSCVLVKDKGNRYKGLKYYVWEIILKIHENVSKVLAFFLLA